MSEIDRLNREVKDLNAQVRRLKDQMNRQYQTMQSDMRRQMADYEQKMRQKAEAQSDQMKARYERELNEMRRKINVQMSLEEKKMTDKYLALMDDLEKTREGVLRREAELEKLVTKYTEDRQKQSEQAQQQADKYLKEMEDTMTQVQKQPYETFFPGKMVTFSGTLRNAWSLMKNGLSQAAAAVAVSVRSALERFSIDIESSKKEWEKELEELCRYCDQFAEILQQWEKIWIEEEDQESRKANAECAAADINYWTKGWYLPAKDWLNERLQRNKKIKETGITEYLKQEGAISIEELREEEKKAAQYLMEYRPYQQLYDITFQNALERQKWAAVISRFMVEEKSYRHDAEDDEMQQADACLRGKEYFQIYNKLILEDEDSTDDYQGWYMMHFYGDNKVRVEISILPVRDGDSLKNMVQFHIFQGENDVRITELLISIQAAIISALRVPGLTILNTNDQKQKEQLQIHVTGRQLVKEVEKEMKSLNG